MKPLSTNGRSIGCAHQNRALAKDAVFGNDFECTLNLPGLWASILPVYNNWHQRVNLMFNLSFDMRQG